MKKLLLALLMLSHSVFAAGPLFSMVPVGSLPVFVLPGQTGAAQYRMTNNTPYALNGLALNTSPSSQTPAGVTQNTVGPGVCSNPFSLQPGGSCVLSLTLTSDDFQNGVAVGGPEVCFTSKNPSRCSVPDANARLNVRSHVAFAGGYNADTSGPLLVQANAQGGGWITSTLPPGTNFSGAIDFIGCNPGLCVAAGINSDIDRPFILQTTDLGASWSFASFSSVPPAFYFVAFTACNTFGCVVAANPSALIQTTNNGMIWNVITTSMSFSAVSCSDSVCIAAGAVGLTTPAILQAVGGSQSWSLADLSHVSSRAVFRASSCQEAFCIAVGNDTGTLYPIIAQTQDAGSSWAQVDLTSFGQQGYLFTAACSNTRCIAAGETVSGTSSLLYQGTSTGTGWAIDTTAPSNLAVFLQSGCSDEICVVGGRDSSNNLAFIQQRTGASAWTYIDPLALLPPAQGPYTHGAIESVSCVGSYCVVAGFVANGSLINIPILFETFDAGTTWANVIPQGIPSGGNLTGTGIP
jgi:photosystem II stability/assembly factor-like uncharacterized protein